MRKTLFRSLLALLSAGLTGAGYMLFEAQWLRLRRRRIEIRDLAPELIGLSVLHISDLHAGAPGPTNRVIKKTVSRAAAAGADLILLTGDLTDKKKDIGPVLAMLSQLKAPLGKFAVLGNHDHGLRKTFANEILRRTTGKIIPGKFEVTCTPLQETVANVRRLLSTADIALLENECRNLRTGGKTVVLCGVDDYQYGYADLDALDGARSLGSLRLLMSHSPDIIDEMEPDSFDLILAGHTHGGQICLPHPSRGRIRLSTSGSKYGSGIYRRGRMAMHVSPGVGTTLLPFRLLSRPEITLLEFVRAR